MRRLFPVLAALALTGCAFLLEVYDEANKPQATPEPIVEPSPTPEPTVAPTPEPTPTPAPISIPQVIGLRVTPFELGGGAALSWQAVLGDSRYVVWRYIEGTPEQDVLFLLPDWPQTNFRDDGSMPPGTYCYKVAARFGSSIGEPSVPVCVPIQPAHLAYIEPVSMGLKMVKLQNCAGGQPCSAGAMSLRAILYDAAHAEIPVDRLDPALHHRMRWRFVLQGGGAGAGDWCEENGRPGLSPWQSAICNGVPGAGMNQGCAGSFYPGSKGLDGWCGWGPKAKAGSVKACAALREKGLTACESYPFVTLDGKIPPGVNWPPRNVNGVCE